MSSIKMKMNFNNLTPNNIQQQINASIINQNVKNNFVRMNMSGKITRNCAALLVQGNKRCSSCGHR